jgi:hypothetical protein
MKGMYIYHMYCYSHSCFQGDVFTNSHALINFAHKSIIIHHIKNLNTWTNHLVLSFLHNNLGYICRLDRGTKFCSNICVWRGCDIYEMIMCKSYKIIYDKVVRQIPNPRFDGYIWGCTISILDTTVQHERV